jgi:hypothetical protein
MEPVAELDHYFICTDVGASVAATRLLQMGLVEGPPNQHPGQGTACRRFFFSNAMLELLWVENPDEAQSEQTRRTRLFERWSNRNASQASCPFGVILHPVFGSAAQCPFESWWSYKPITMPGLELQIADSTSLDEPMWCYFPFGRKRPIESPRSPAGLTEVTGIRIHSPQPAETSVTAAMARAGLIDLITPASEHLLEVMFDGGSRGKSVDLRPDLPLILLS